LRYDHAERLTAKEAIAHPWLAPARERAAIRASTAKESGGAGTPSPLIPSSGPSLGGKSEWIGGGGSAVGASSGVGAGGKGR